MEISTSVTVLIKRGLEISLFSVVLTGYSADRKSHIQWLYMFPNLVETSTNKIKVCSELLQQTILSTKRAVVEALRGECSFMLVRVSSYQLN